MKPTSPKAKKIYWIVVANEASAIVYGRETWRGPLEELFKVENDDGRKKTGDLISDRGGRSFDSFGQGRHTMARENTGPKRESSLRFARDLAGRIKGSLHAGSCRGYVLIAAPRFLGELRHVLENMVTVKPMLTIDKDVVGQDKAVLKKLLAR